MPRPDLTTELLDELAGASSRTEVRDALSGVLTRGAFKAAMRCRSQAEATQSLIVVDIDHFQKVNDGCGHETGDRVLYLAANRLRRAVGTHGFVGRTGGDEFGIFFPDGSEAIDDDVALLRGKLAHPFAAAGHAVTLTVSAGVASASDTDWDADELIQAATIALHEAEKERNYGLFFSPSMRDRARFQTALEQDLRASMAYEQTQIKRAAELDEFHLHYQPVFDSEDHAITAFEALLRWQHPLRGLVSPGDFIPLAEEIGLIGQLGQWVLYTACREAARWPAGADGKAPSVCVNVSPYQVREGKAFLTVVEGALRDSGLPPQRLTVELTESALVHDTAEVLAGLREMGVALAIDDFGTGYSSLSHILRFPFSTIKIDKYFIQAIEPEAAEAGADPGSAGWLIRAIGSLSDGLGVTTVAEGVENEAEAAVVRQAGITHIQGFLYGRPLPASEARGLLAPPGDVAVPSDGAPAP